METKTRKELEIAASTISNIVGDEFTFVKQGTGRTARFESKDKVLEIPATSALDASSVLKLAKRSIDLFSEQNHVQLDLDGNSI